MIQKAVVMGNWWLAASSRQCTHCCIMQSFLVQHQITQLNQPPYSSDLAPCDFWLFSKLKSPLKGKRFQTINEIQENMMGGLILIGRTVWGPKVPTSKGTEVSLICVPSFLYLVSSSINDSIFHITWLDTFWTDLIFVMDFIWDPTLPFRISSDFHLK